jgi:hypothetical protein
MEYKKKVIVLLSIIGALVLIYALTVVFNSGILRSGSSSYSWLDSKLASRTARIVINRDNEEIELVKKNNSWFVVNNDKEYPARQLRVNDFIGTFTKRSSWPVRSSSASSHERLGLGSSASRITLFGENSTLLDILFGMEDVTGQEIYVRRAGQNEVRSGENIFASYARSPVTGWYNLKLIPETEDGKLDVDNVQRMTVYNQAATQVFSKRNRQWVVSGFEVENLSQSNVEVYIRTVLNMEGDDFADNISADDLMFSFSRIVLELGNGGIRTIRISDGDETGRRYAIIDGSSFVYSIAPWAAQRLFKSSLDFEMQ